MGVGIQCIRSARGRDDHAEEYSCAGEWADECGGSSGWGLSLDCVKERWDGVGMGFQWLRSAWRRDNNAAADSGAGERVKWSHIDCGGAAGFYPGAEVRRNSVGVGIQRLRPTWQRN